MEQDLVGWRPLPVPYASGGSISEGAYHMAFWLMDLRLFKYSSLPGLGQRTTCARAGKVLRAALFEFNRRPGFKTHPAGQGHDPNGCPATKATLAPKDLNEEV